jgi:hypothetical protein
MARKQPTILSINVNNKALLRLKITATEIEVYKARGKTNPKFKLPLKTK